MSICSVKCDALKCQERVDNKIKNNKRLNKNTSAFHPKEGVNWLKSVVQFIITYINHKKLSRKTLEMSPIEVSRKFHNPALCFVSERTIAQNSSPEFGLNAIIPTGPSLVHFEVKLTSLIDRDGDCSSPASK